MAFQAPENDCPVILGEGTLTSTSHIVIDHPQAALTPSHQYNALTSPARLLPPDTAAPGLIANSQTTWLNPPYSHIQNIPFFYPPLDGLPPFHPLISTQLGGHGDAPLLFQPEMVNQRPGPTPNNGWYTYPYQTQPACDSHANWEAARLPCHPGTIPAPPRGKTKGLSMSRKGHSVSPGVSLEHRYDFPTRVRSNHDLCQRQPAPSQPSRATPRQSHLSREPPQSKPRSYNRPGKEPAAEHEPDAIELQAVCEQRGGSASAVDWIPVVFNHGVTNEALLRPLNRSEIDQANAPADFEPRQAYDGFLLKIEGSYECGLCKEGKRTVWKNKKDAPRHLRKFHFGLADTCTICGKSIYSNGEMNSHRCKPFIAATGVTRGE